MGPSGPTLGAINEQDPDLNRLPVLVVAAVDASDGGQPETMNQHQWIQRQMMSSIIMISF